ncbi:MAG TPA: abscisic acid-deficient protein Aba4 family protein [Archangium sp.]|uniref:abscisic acid-deficient protein Aba4 family protein n=1 Tax=Archangium sp. TaxID=1872627 RepID=UPI002E362F74|nr:abscisic acid-deficient protein Aba4 family protein [Archangium sp.]HEX5754666.1 abscisic acid-deficient protein Aba4 family protein [Archangium sp.]
MPALKPLFQLASLASLLGWLALAVLPGWRHTESLVLGTSVLLMIAIYAWLLKAALTQKPEPGAGRPGFFTLGGVLALLRNPTAALAAWVHILVFDLMVGLYIRQEGALAGIRHGALIPCYLLTLMFGPLGLLAFLGLRLLLGG